MRRAALAVALLLAAPANATTCNVVAIHDGDTFTCVADRTEIKVRIKDIDAPEIGRGRKSPGQPFGVAAREALSELVWHRDVRIEGSEKSWGRLVARVYVDEDTDVGAMLVGGGYAWVYREYLRGPKNAARLKELAWLEYSAKCSTPARGLWAEPAVPPWEYRHPSTDTYRGPLC